MNKVSFLNKKEVKTFIAFIVEKWNGNFDFNLGIKENGNTKPAAYKQIWSIKEAKELYRWGYSITGFDKNEMFDLSGNTYNQSEGVLNSAGKMLKNKELNKGSRLILKWGGVYKKGNIQICEGSDLVEKLEEAELMWSTILDKPEFTLDPKTDLKFPSNAGFTKIYSVHLKDFIIYDSRVAAALAFLVKDCFKENNLLEEKFNELRFFIPASYLPKINNEKDRRVVGGVFKSTNNDPRKHFYSNVVANIILKEALNKIQENDSTVSLRELEAALFMIGYDIRNNASK